MTKTNTFSVLIIGAGNIGATFDTPKSLNILSHAHAFKIHNGFKLIGFFDSDAPRAQKAADIWKVPAFLSIPEAFKSNQVDIVSICVPDEFHFQVVSEVLNFPVKLVFLEKPLARSIKEAEQILQISKEKNIPIVVNYSRRFVSEMITLKQDIAENKFGKFIAGTGLYGKGILHNGTHVIDLLRFLLGEIQNASEISRIFDFYKNDPTVSAIFTLNNNSLFCLHGIDCTKYTIFELDFLFEKARLRLIDSGFKVELYHLKESDRFAGFKNLDLKNRSETDLNKAMLNAVDHIYKVLVENKPIRCSASDAYEAMKITMRFDNGN